MTIPYLEGLGRNIERSDPQLVILKPQIYLIEDHCILQLVKQIINLKKRVLVLDNHLVELAIVNTHSQNPSLFFTNRTGGPHCGILGQMNALLNKS